jgi:hypothetical protein
VTKTLDDIIGTVEASFESGTPEYEAELRRLKVSKCMEMQDVESCTGCIRFGDCELRIAYWRDLQFGGQE